MRTSNGSVTVGYSWRVLAALALAAIAGCGSGAPHTLAIGAPAPDFSLPGVDGRVHTLAENAGSPVLVVIFTCNHCPAAQLYERRIQQLYRDYRQRGAAIVAINPDGPTTTALTDLAYTDVPDSLEGMIERSADRRLEYPYLYDGSAQVATDAFKVVATPQAYVFDDRRTLRYVGRIDDSPDEDHVKTRDVRAAINALLARQPVRIATTEIHGCPVRRQGDTEETQKEHGDTAIAPVSLQAADAQELKRLRGNPDGKLTLVNFWATWCGPCISEFPELQTIFRTYRSRGLDLVTIAIDVPDARPNVMKWLQDRQASSRNYIFASDDTTGLQQAFDPALPSFVPFTLLLGPGGDVRYQQEGAVQGLALRRAILAHLPGDPRYPTMLRYWAH